MRTLGKLTGVVALASVLAMPSAQARPRLGGALFLPLAIVGGIAGAAIGSRKARAHRSYARHTARRDRAAIREARRERAAAIREARRKPQSEQAIPRPDGEQMAPMPQQSRAPQAAIPSRAVAAGWAGPLFWPHAYDGVFEYALGLPGDDKQFWARGFGDVIDGMFATPERETTGSAGQRGWENLCGAETAKPAEATVTRIRDAVQPTQAQQPALDELRAALLRATERIEGACPSQRAAAPPERLNLMISRLTAMRQAVNTVGPALRTFYDQLSDQQKAALERMGDGATPQADAAAGCATPVANWPQGQIERVLQPTQAQRASLERLRQTSLGMAQFVASTCPREAPRTAPERLEAVKERLGALRYAASNVRPAYEQFYASLSDTQKARFQSMSRDQRAENRR